jgi:hypothetical protein
MWRNLQRHDVIDFKKEAMPDETGALKSISHQNPDTPELSYVPSFESAYR